MTAQSAQQRATPQAQETKTRGYQPRQLVLLGSGMANLRVLRAMAAKPLPEMRVTLLAPYPRAIYPGMLPGLVTGRHRVDDGAIAIEPLVRRAGIRWLPRSATAIDAESRTIELDDGGIQHYDWLSINTGPVQNRAHMELEIPGAGEFGLFAHPIEGFAALWPRVCELADQKARRIAIIGDAPSAMELALAVRQRLPQSTVTLVIKPGPLFDQGSDEPQQTSPARLFRDKLMAALREQGITVLPDVAQRIGADAIHLACGADLACDIPLIALENQRPVWMQESGLAEDAQGQLDVDAFQRSTSHREVFAARDDGATLAHNIAAAVSGRHMYAAPDADKAIQFLYCGESRALARWGQLQSSGLIAAWLKNWYDRRQMARYRLDAA
jgi:NADH dehydrogenase FAD-containing subunit